MKKKISGTAAIKSVPSHSVVYSGENPTREIAQRLAIWTLNSKDPDWDAVEETAPTQWITVAGPGLHSGYLVFRHKNGDESYGSFAGTHMVTVKDDGTWEMAYEGVKSLMGGTGKFSNIRGALNYKGKAIPEGEGEKSEFDWEGDVEY